MNLHIIIELHRKHTAIFVHVIFLNFVVQVITVPIRNGVLIKKQETSF
jgi:hypothetical protein